MTLNKVDDDLRAKLVAQWPPDALVELTALIAFQNLSSKFNAAPGILPHVTQRNHGINSLKHAASALTSPVTLRRLHLSANLTCELRCKRCRPPNHRFTKITWRKPKPEPTKRSIRLCSCTNPGIPRRLIADVTPHDVGERVTQVRYFRMSFAALASWTESDHRPKLSPLDL